MKPGYFCQFSSCLLFCDDVSELQWLLTPWGDKLSEDTSVILSKTDSLKEVLSEEEPESRASEGTRAGTEVGHSSLRVLEPSLGFLAITAVKELSARQLLNCVCGEVSNTCKSSQGYRDSRG